MIKISSSQPPALKTFTRPNIHNYVTEKGKCLIIGKWKLGAERERGIVIDEGDLTPDPKPFTRLSTRNCVRDSSNEKSRIVEIESEERG